MTKTHIPLFFFRCVHICTYMSYHINIQYVHNRCGFCSLILKQDGLKLKSDMYHIRLSKGYLLVCMSAIGGRRKLECDECYQDCGACRLHLKRGFFWYRHYPKLHQMVEYRSSRALVWTNLRQISMRVFFASRKWGKMTRWSKKHKNVVFRRETN